jgi:uncharacterized integral membrane protein
MQLEPRTEALDYQFNRLQRIGLLVAGIGLLLCLVGAWLDSRQFFASYLYAYVFWLGIALGSLAWLMIYHLTGGDWGVATRRLLETAGQMSLLMGLLFLPLILGLDDLYHWTHAEAVAEDPLLQHKAPYLNVPFFLVRALIYFAVWIGITWRLNTWSRTQDRPDAPPVLRDRLRRFSGPALAAYGVTITFAAIDWIMSLEPHWYSSIFGLLVASGQVLASLAFLILILSVLAQFQPLADVATARLYGDLGNLLLAATLLAAYLAFMQFLIIWSGNLPEDVTWYLHRLEGGWSWVAILLILLQFAVPFALLLSRRLKRDSRRLTAVAAMLALATLIHFFWMVAPAIHAGEFRLHWLDLVTPLAIGGLWVAAFIWRLRTRPLLVLADVQAQEGGAHG